MSKRTRYYIGTLAAILLIVAFMTGCKKLSEAQNTTFPEEDTQDESDGFGVYVEIKRDADDMLLGEGTFLYDVTQEKLYVTVTSDGVTCAACDSQ